MKKKIFLTVLVVMALACLFAVSISAENVYDKTAKFKAADGTELALYDANGAPLAWFYDSTTSKYVSYRVVTDFTFTLGSGRELHTNNPTINDTDNNSETTFPYSLSDMILLNAREYSAFTYISGTWKDLPIQAIYVNDNFQWINKQSFNGCTTLKVFDIPKEQRATKLHIGGSAFANATALEYFYIPKNAAFESTSTFEYSGLKTAVFADDWANSLQGYEFYSCYSLESVTLPSTLTKIPNYTFAFKSKVNDNTTNFRITIPANVKTIDYRCFQNNTSLVEINFAGTSLTKLDGAVFENCTRLTSLAIPEGVTYIGTALCLGCSSLTTVSLPTTLTTADSGNHFWNTAITQVIGLENTQLTSIPGSMFRGLKNWKPETIVLPNTVKSIGQYGLADVGMTNIVLGAGITKIEHEAFTGCANLKNVYVPSTITTMGSAPFNGRGVYFFVTSSDENYLATIAAKAGTTNYVSITDYNKNPDNYKSGKWVIYGLNTCETFYDGVHAASESAGTNKFVGEAYVSNYANVVACGRNCGKENVTLICGPLFENKGYSKAQDSSSFTYGITINDANIAKYEEHTKSVVNYGFVIGAVPTTGTIDEIVNADGTTNLATAVLVNFTDIEYASLTIYNVKMVGIEEDKINTSIYCCAYVIDGESVSYMGNAVTEKAVTISAFEIEKIETTTPPTQEGNDEQA